MSKVVNLCAVILAIINIAFCKYTDKRKCPEVRAVPHFDLEQVGIEKVIFNSKIILIKYKHKYLIRISVLYLSSYWVITFININN